MVNKQLDEQQLKAVCNVLAETNLGYTKTELIRLLEQSKIEIASDGRSSNAYGYTMGLNKRDWLYNCLAMEINKNHSFALVYTFLEKALNPVAFTDERSRDKYNYLLEGTNKALLLAGLEITKEGKLTEVVQAKTLDEVDRRVNSLQKQLYNRAIHMKVRKYCIKDYLQKDYYDAVFEAAKGLVLHCGNNSEYSTRYLCHHCVVVSQRCTRHRLLPPPCADTNIEYCIHCYFHNAVLEILTQQWRESGCNKL